jgi:hypothetical protein
MKHLKVVADLANGGETFHFTLLEQTNFKSEFGNYTVEDYGNYAFIHGEVCLFSGSTHPRPVSNIHDWPELKLIGIKILVWLYGGGMTYEREFPKTCMNAGPVEWWPKIKAAVEAYNEFYKG